MDKVVIELLIAPYKSRLQGVILYYSGINSISYAQWT